MGVSRSSIYYQRENIMKQRYKKKDDDKVLAQIEEIIEARPTYGYKRVTAMINKNRKQNNLEKYNKKRILRVMDINGLLLPKNPITREHEATGKIITLHSNTRWCSDGFEIKCFNGEKVYVAFILVCYDRECLSYVAYNRPLLGLDIQELMIKSVESRFNKTRAPREIQFLSDRGSIYRDKATVEIGRQLGLK